MEKVCRKRPEGPYGDLGPHLPFEPDEGHPPKKTGGNISVLEDEEPSEGKSPDVEYDPDWDFEPGDGSAYEQQCFYPSLP